MSIGSTLQVLMRLARAAFASILLVGVPLADAATCGGEDLHVTIERSAPVDRSETAFADASVGGSEHDTQRSGDSQHCVHGHCHHSTSFRDGERLLNAMTEGDVIFAAPISDAVLSGASAGLERPPKT